MDECRKYIDDNLGLREDYADYMARCAWEACNPVLTGKWKTMSPFSLEIELSTKWKLEKINECEEGNVGVRYNYF